MATKLSTPRLAHLPLASRTIACYVAESTQGMQSTLSWCRTGTYGSRSIPPVRQLLRLWSIYLIPSKCDATNALAGKPSQD
jgi:hypothetical protein